jgi:hypothetical protein
VPVARAPSAKVVGLGAREARELLRDPHRLLLVEDHAVGRVRDRPQALVDVRDRFRVALVSRVGVDVPHRPRAVQRVERNEILELGRAHLLERLPHAVGLELEHPHGIAPLEHLVGLGVVERQ